MIRFYRVTPVPRETGTGICTLANVQISPTASLISPNKVIQSTRENATMEKLAKANKTHIAMRTLQRKQINRKIRSLIKAKIINLIKVIYILSMLEICLNQYYIQKLLLTISSLVILCDCAKQSTENARVQYKYRAILNGQFFCIARVTLSICFAFPAL